MKLTVPPASEFVRARARLTLVTAASPVFSSSPDSKSWDSIPPQPGHWVCGTLRLRFRASWICSLTSLNVGPTDGPGQPAGETVRKQNVPEAVRVCGTGGLMGSVRRDRLGTGGSRRGGDGGRGRSMDQCGRKWKAKVNSLSLSSANTGYCSTPGLHLVA